MSLSWSDSIAAIAPAFIKAQSVSECAVKDSTNPHFKNKYADLGSVWDACRDGLHKNGLGVIQSPGEFANGTVPMTTMLIHSSGEWVRGEMSIPVSKSDAQGYGSAVTYARRYALGAMIGIIADDDDGNAASHPPAKREPPRQQRNDAPQIDEVAPPEGWGDWARGIIATVADADTPTLDKIVADQKHRINAVKKVDATMHKAIGEAFKHRREILADEIPF